MYILVFAKYSTEYLAYYVYVHESMVEQVLLRFVDRGIFWVVHLQKMHADFRLKFPTGFRHRPKGAVQTLWTLSSVGVP